MKKFFIFAMLSMLVAGCESNRAVESSRASDLVKEGTVSFARPADFTIWPGSHSQRDLFEVVYENFTRNEAGQAVVQIGLRYRGPTGWTNWFVTAQKHITIMGRCDFYAAPGGQASGGPVVYSTNDRAITVRLGETCDFKAVCPIKSAQSYHVTLSQN